MNVASKSMGTLFSTAYVERATQLFLHPTPRYSWAEIVAGAPVSTAQGTIRRFSAVDMNTFRGFHRVDKTCPGAKEGFRRYFLEEKRRLIEALSQVESDEQLHLLANRICQDIRDILTNVQTKQLRPYNKVRKPVDLYLQGLVALATELDSQRSRLIPFLFVPLDSQILGHPDLFTGEELRQHRLSRRATYKDVTTEATYQALQTLLQDKARAVATELGREFHRIYFDLLWNERYRRWGGNIFETNPT